MRLETAFMLSFFIVSVIASLSLSCVKLEASDEVVETGSVCRSTYFFSVLEEEQPIGVDCVVDEYDVPGTVVERAF